MALGIDRLVLRSTDVEASDSFVAEHFGDLVAVSHVPVGDGSGSTSPYWKYSVFCDDVDVVRDRLTTAGSAVSDPVQFGDIGYLCHVTEPGGNAIELLQRTFDGEPPLDMPAPERLGLVTLRVSDPVAADRFYRDALGMRLLATMAVDDGRPDPFDLYFYALDHEPPPDPDPSAVVNRPWLYQRPFALIELQHHRLPAPPTTADADDRGPGLASIDLVADDLGALAERLTGAAVAHERHDDELRFQSPDGHPFRCRRRG